MCIYDQPEEDEQVDIEEDSLLDRVYFYEDLLVHDKSNQEYQQSYRALVEAWNRAMHCHEEPHFNGEE